MAAFLFLLACPGAAVVRHWPSEDGLERCGARGRGQHGAHHGGRGDVDRHPYLVRPRGAGHPRRVHDRRRPSPSQPARGKGASPLTPLAVPILLYHAVDDSPPGWIAPFTVKPEVFHRHLDLIAALGCQPLTVTEMADRLQPGQAWPDRPVVITFDDGFADVASVVAPALAARGFPGHRLRHHRGAVSRPDQHAPPIAAGGHAPMGSALGARGRRHRTGRPHADAPAARHPPRRDGLHGDQRQQGRPRRRRSAIPFGASPIPTVITIAGSPPSSGRPDSIPPVRSRTPSAQALTIPSPSPASPSWPPPRTRRSSSGCSEGARRGVRPAGNCGPGRAAITAVSSPEQWQ